MRPTALVVSFATLAVVVAACGGGGGGGSGGGSGGGGAVSFSTQVQPLFTNYCILCHAPGGSASFLHLTAGSSYAQLVGVASTLTAGGGARVQPSDSTSSVLWKRVSGVGLDVTESVMPPGFIMPSAELALIRAWIDEGAPNN